LACPGEKGRDQKTGFSANEKMGTRTPLREKTGKGKKKEALRSYHQPKAKWRLGDKSKNPQVKKNNEKGKETERACKNT